MPIHRSPGRKAFRNARRIEAGSPVATNRRAAPGASPPDWDAVAELLSDLARTRAVFPTVTSRSSWISAYEPGRRLKLESGIRSSWVRVEHIRTCWEFFERRGRICRQDVLEPGRQSAFMMALFEHLPGVRREDADGRYLVLERAPNRSGRTRIR